jgi:hypothetical protein
MNSTLTLAQLGSVMSGVAVERDGFGACAVMVGDLNASGVLPRQLTNVGPPKAGSDARLRAGDIVISLRGNGNFCAVVPSNLADQEPVFATLDAAVIRLADESLVIPEYLTTYLNLPSTQLSLSEHRSGTGALRLSLAPLKELQIPVPTSDSQSAIAALNTCAMQEQALLGQLTALRTNLIHELLRQAAAEGPAKGIHPEQATTGPNGPGTTARALSTRAER